MAIIARKQPKTRIGNKVHRMDADFFDCVFDILETPAILALSDVPHHLRTSRLEHCLNVAYRSYRAARLLRLDYRSTARGALLHDFYIYTPEEERTRKDAARHLVEHPFKALENARALFALNPIEEDIIVKHMWLVTKKMPSYRESMIVTMMDKYCATLEFLGLTPSETEVSRTMVAQNALAARNMEPGIA